MPEILVILEAEIGRIKVWGQPRVWGKVQEIPFQWKKAGPGSRGTSVIPAMVGSIKQKDHGSGKHGQK
jgi:hypothetical protein